MEIKVKRKRKDVAIKAEPAKINISKDIMELLGEGEGIRQNIYPQNFEVNNTKVARELMKDFPNTIETKINVGQRKKKGPAGLIYVTLSLPWDDKNVTISGNVNLNKLDMQRIDAVCSLIAAGNEKFTPEMIHRVAAGLEPDAVVTAAAIKQVEESIEKAQRAFLTVNCSGLVKAWGKDLTDPKLEGNLLPLEKRSAKVKGRHKAVYKALGKPIIYQYAEISNYQLIQIPKELHCADIGISRTPENAVLWDHFIKDLMVMKQNKLHRRTGSGQRLKVESFAKECEIPIKFRSQEARLIEKMEHLIATAKREGMVFTFKKVKDPRGKTVAYDFIFPKE